MSLSALLSDFNLSSLANSSPSAPSPSSSYPACSRSWGSTPGPQVLPSIEPFLALRTTSAAPSCCLPQQPNRPVPGLSSLLQLNTPQPQSTMSLNGSFPNNNNQTHTEIQLASRNMMINNTHPQSNNHRRGQCSLNKTVLWGLITRWQSEMACDILSLAPSHR